MNCICSVSSAFTYSEFQRAKINGLHKIFLKNVSLYLLGHLREKNQRSKRTFHLFGISEGWNSTVYGKSSKNFRSLITGLGKVRFGWFLKNYFLLFSSTALKSKMPNLRWKNIWAKEKRASFFGLSVISCGRIYLTKSLILYDWKKREFVL